MEKRNLLLLTVLCAVGIAGTASAADAPNKHSFIRKRSWIGSMLASREKLTRQQRIPVEKRIPRLGRQDFTVMAWVRPEREGVLFSKTHPEHPWQRGAKSYLIFDDDLVYEIRDKDRHSMRARLLDGKWHHVVISASNMVHTLYLDGKRSHSRPVRYADEPDGSVFQIGYMARNFPHDVGGFDGLIDEMRLYNRGVSDAEVKAAFEKKQSQKIPGLIAYFPFEGNAKDMSGTGNNPTLEKGLNYAPGKYGQALKLKGDGSRIVLAAEDAEEFLAAYWNWASNTFTSGRSKREMAWEREDGIWKDAWKPGQYARICKAYAQASHREPELQKELYEKLPSLKGLSGLKAARDVYLKTRRMHFVKEITKLRNPREAIAIIHSLTNEFPDVRRQAAASEAVFTKLEEELKRWVESDIDTEAVDRWTQKFDVASRTVFQACKPAKGIDKIVFVKRKKYTSNHYYTDYVNSGFFPVGNICILDLKNGQVTEVVDGLEGGMFGKFDLSYDAQRVVFAWKKAHNEGYRIYECAIDGSGLRQLTFPPEIEKELQRKYRVRYHHGTDDMDPCYLPDGGICFISTRCQYGILCDAPDDFTTTVLYRMDGNGSNIVKLTNSSVSEANPSVANDGRILYTRWEYVDKGAVGVKCIWSMHPDGSGSSEVYGNDISLPPTMNQVRAIPGENNKYVILGCPHYPQNNVGSIIRIDMTKDVRTRDPMTYMTPDVDVRNEGGYWWESQEKSGQRLFRDPYPLSDKWFLVTEATGGTDAYRNQTQWGIYLLNEKGRILHIYDDHPTIGSFQPMPLRPRPVPPILPSVGNQKLAKENKALCIVTDVYRGMEGIKPGEVKYLRINEQAPRPWASRRRWGGDQYDQQHVCITKDTHLGLKVQHGIVPVEADGSACFIVEADRNIFLQALDENFMELQRERTYVNYRPGEIRSCVGCHEKLNDVPDTEATKVPMALKRPPSIPGPQPGETSGSRPLYFAADVQPVLDKHCIECHSGAKPDGKLDLSGEMTELFSVAYEKLIPERRGGKGRRGPDLIGPTIGENHPKTGNVHYLPPKSLGSHASVLVAMLYPDNVQLKDPDQAALAKKLVAEHKNIKLTEPERVKLTTWVDSNGQYYGSWWGRRNIRYKDHPNFRPVPTFEQAVSRVSPIPEEER